MQENSAARRLVLAYSGGLDTSVILVWLQEAMGCEVIAFTADLGQGEDLEAARDKALALGARAVVVEDLRETFVADYVWPMLRANALYEGEYLLGTSIARPLIAKALAKAAQDHGATAVGHGATGKGNDQVRFELSLAALAPTLEVVAPWRFWPFKGRSDLMAYARDKGIPIEGAREHPPYSEDANLLHISYEGGELEDPWFEPNPAMWKRTVDVHQTPDEPAVVTIDFLRGDPVALDGEALSAAELLARLNDLAGRHGIGRVDMVENRFVGMKSRGCYETPGGTVLWKAHRAMESLTLDREAAHLKDDIMPRYASLIYNGFWFSPEREALQALIDATQRNVSGTVRLRLFKGAVMVTGRRAERSLFDASISSFENDQGTYNQKDAEGFIRLNALRLRLAAVR